MENFRQINFKQERDFSSLLNTTFEFLKQEFKPLLRILLIRLAPFLILIGVFSALSMDNIANNMSSNPLAIFSFYYIAQMLLTLFAMVYLQSLTLHYIKHYNSDSMESREEYVKNNALSKVIELVGVNIGYGFLVGLATLLFIIPGIYVFVVFSLVYVITVLGDGEPGVFKKSSTLIKNHWWETFGGLIVVFIVYYIITLIFAIPNSMMFLFDAFTGAYDGTISTSNNIVLDIITSIIASFGLLSAIIMYIYLSFNYYSLMEQKEATGLLDQIDQMEQDLSEDNA